MASGSSSSSSTTGSGGGTEEASSSSSSGGVGLVDRERRERCWTARDAYHECLAAGGPAGEASEERCRPAFQQYAQACPRSWLVHFEKRRKVEEERRAREARQASLYGRAG